MRNMEYVTDDHAELCSTLDETRECAMCSGKTSQCDNPTYFTHRGKTVLMENWKCGKCGMGGNILRNTDTGEIVRLSHLHTGEGFIYPQE